MRNLAGFVISQLATLNWAVKSISHKQYQEQYILKTNDDREMQIQSYYDKSKRIKSVSSTTQDSPTFETLHRTLLDNRSRFNYLRKKPFENETQSFIFQNVIPLLQSQEIFITQIISSEYQEQFTFESDEGYCICGFNYDAKGFISTVLAIKTNSKALCEKVKDIALTLKKTQS